MLTIDAKAIRERLNQLALIVAQLEPCCPLPRQMQIIAQAQTAIREIAALVTADEQEEHGEAAPPAAAETRRRVRRQAMPQPPPRHSKVA